MTVAGAALLTAAGGFALSRAVQVRRQETILRHYFLLDIPSIAKNPDWSFTAPGVHLIMLDCTDLSELLSGSAAR